MKTFTLVLTAIGVTLLCPTGDVLAESAAIQKMAKITMGLKHYPSDEDKAVLRGIIDSEDSTDEEADIAMAISNIEHKVIEKDVERVEDIINDDSTEESVRQLASIVLRINHTPSDEDMKLLAALAEE